MKTYKVWVEVEEYDSETEEGTTLHEETDWCYTAEFHELSKAVRFAEALHEEGEKLATDHAEDLVSI